MPWMQSNNIAGNKYAHFHNSNFIFYSINILLKIIEL